MSETDLLLERVSQGDSAAISHLLDRYRDRVRRMVAVWIDPRTAQRFDPSDVVQEVLLDAFKRLPKYSQQRPLPFYPWLRKLAWERLVQYNRLHLKAQRRSVCREQEVWFDHSAAQLAHSLAQGQTSVGGRLIRSEAEERLKRAILQLSERDRIVLVMRFLERLSVADVAAVLSLTPEAVGMRQLRALQRLRRLLDSLENDS